MLLGSACGQGRPRGPGGRNNNTSTRGPYHRLPRFDEVLADAGNFIYGGKNRKHGRKCNILFFHFIFQSEIC